MKDRRTISAAVVALMLAGELGLAGRAVLAGPQDPPPTTAGEPAPAAPAAAPATSGATGLEGQVRTARRRWVTGAAVVVQRQSGEAGLWITTTDEKGTYKLDSLPPGSYSVQFLKHGLAPVTKEAVEVRFPFKAVVEVAMEPLAAATALPEPAAPGGPPSSAETTSLEGRIARGDGAPVPEARIRLVHGGGAVDPIEVVTDRDGAFRVAELPAGPWRLEILGAGFLPIRVPVNLARDPRASVVLVPQPASYLPQPLDLMPPETPIPPPEPAPPAGR